METVAYKRKWHWAEMPKEYGYIPAIKRPRLLMDLKKKIKSYGHLLRRVKACRRTVKDPVSDAERTALNIELRCENISLSAYPIEYVLTMLKDEVTEMLVLYGDLRGKPHLSEDHPRLEVHRLNASISAFLR